jgi:two-component system, chemotaxis family, chemotaxis protein CheY
MSVEQERPPERFVLLVEDDADIRSTIADILSLEGYRVVTAKNGKEALQRLRDVPRPFLILLDLMMPDMNGWEFREKQLGCRELSSIPVVVLSGGGMIERATASLGAAEYLRKPVDIDRLLATVQSYG